MKKITVLFTFPMILALTMLFTTNTQAQDTTHKIYMDNTDQNWPSTSGILIASRDSSTAHGPWEDLDLFEISYFIDESIKNETLIGYGSSSSSRERLNFMKTKIDNAAYALKYSTFDETCQLLLDAYFHTDGLSEIPDIVYGKAATELAMMIEYMRIEIIGCE